MVWQIDSGTLAIGLVVIVAFAFFFGSVLDAIMHENAFGPTVNTLLFAAGFVASVYYANSHGVGVGDLKLTAGCGLAGAFGGFSILALAKAGLSRR